MAEKHPRRKVQKRADRKPCELCGFIDPPPDASSDTGPVHMTCAHAVGPAKTLEIAASMRLQVAKREERRAKDFASGVAHIASGAEMLISAGFHGQAQEVLSLMKRAHIEFLRYNVAREPGGIAYDGAQSEGKPEASK